MTLYQALTTLWLLVTDYYGICKAFGPIRRCVLVHFTVVEVSFIGALFGGGLNATGRYPFLLLYG